MCLGRRGSLPSALDRMRPPAPVRRESCRKPDGPKRAPSPAAGKLGKQPVCRSPRNPFKKTLASAARKAIMLAFTKVSAQSTPISLLPESFVNSARHYVECSKEVSWHFGGLQSLYL